MAHQRKIIREAVAAQLVGKTGAAARVFETRLVPYRRLELPALAVYTKSESVDPASADTSPRELRRNLQLVVEGAVKLGEDVDDALDQLALEVERAMDADRYFGGAAGESVLTSTDTGISEEGDRPIGILILTYAVTYRTDSPAAADLEPLPDFTTADVKTDLSGTTAPGNQAEDRIAVPIT